jgi:hypothetical protein
MNQTTIKHKTASDTLHELYLDTVKWVYFIILVSFLAGLSWTAYKVYQYFKSNSLPEIGMDFLIIALPLVQAYSIVKQIKRIRSKQ